MRLPRMTTRGIMISIAVVGFSLGLMIKLTLAYSAAVADAPFTRPQTIIVGVCAYAATPPISHSINSPRTGRGWRVFHRRQGCMKELTTIRAVSSVAFDADCRGQKN